MILKSAGPVANAISASWLIRHWTLPYLSAENKIKILSKKTRPTKDLKRPRGGTGGEVKSFLRTVTV